LIFYETSPPTLGLLRRRGLEGVASGSMGGLSNSILALFISRMAASSDRHISIELSFLSSDSFDAFLSADAIEATSSLEVIMLFI
jgi:hypothetical protein